MAGRSHAAGVVDWVGECADDRTDRALARDARRRTAAIAQHDFDRFGHAEDRVGEPIGIGDLGKAEDEVFRERLAAAWKTLPSINRPTQIGLMISPQSLHDGASARPDFARAAVVRRIALTFRLWH